MNHTVMNVANAIDHKIQQLEQMRGEIKGRATNKAKAISEYDKALAKQILIQKEQLGYPVTLAEKLAKGKCYSERYDMELADGLYKSLISNMNCVQAELNGLQSINRHLSEL